MTPHREKPGSVRAKVQRARANLRMLEADRSSFLASRPFEIATRHDPKTGEAIYYAARVDPIPLSIAATAADILHNLRRALDYLAVELIRTAGNSPIRNSGFPICASFAIYQTQGPEKLQGVSKDALDAIAAIQPYRGGNAALWSLQSLSAIDKHRLVSLVAVAVRFQNVTPAVMAYARRMWNDLYAAWRPPESFSAESADFIEGIKRQFRLTNGDVVFITAPDTETVDIREFSFDLAFGEGETGRSTLLETLGHLLEEVESVAEKLGALLM